MASGYSGTPLPKKLGIAAGHRVLFINEPPNFRQLLGELPEGIVEAGRARAPIDLIVFFAGSNGEMLERLPKLASSLAPAGMLWIAWPKRSSGVTTDLGEEAVRAAGLGTGLVDNKVCAIDEVWSGLRFVIRLRDRA